jgi:HEAT repeat protein
MERIDRLIAELKNPDKVAKMAAASSLGRMGGRAKASVPALMLLLEAQDEDLRTSSWLALAKIGRAAVPFLIKALASPLASIRTEVVEILGKIKDPGDEILPALIATLLEDPDWTVRFSVTFAIFKIGRSAATTVPALIAALHDPATDVRYGAIAALSRFDDLATAAVPSLIEALFDCDPRIRSSAASSLAEIGDSAVEAIPALTVQLEDSETYVRESMIYALGNLGHLSPRSVRALLGSLADAESSIRGSAASALGKIGGPAAQAVAKLTALLADTDNSVRWNAAEALGKIGGPAASSVPVLISALADSQLLVRSEAARALGEIGHPAEDCVLALIKAMEDHKAVRKNAATALGKIGVSASMAVNRLTRALFDADKDVCNAAATALGKIGRPAHSSVAALIKVLDVPAYRDVWFEAACALVSIGGPASTAASPTLIAALIDSRPDIRLRATEALKKLGSTAVPALEEARILHPDPKTRLAVFPVLAELAPEKVLVEGAACEPNHPHPIPDDDRILSLFKDLDANHYLTIFQVFWCIGCVDRNAIESAGVALAYDKLQRQLRALDPHFHHHRLPTSISYIRETCLIHLETLFVRPPFRLSTPSDPESGLRLRREFNRGKRVHGRWTPEARTAWSYIDRFLSLTECLPVIAVSEQ